MKLYSIKKSEDGTTYEVATKEVANVSGKCFIDETSANAFNADVEKLANSFYLARLKDAISKASNKVSELENKDSFDRDKMAEAKKRLADAKAQLATWEAEGIPVTTFSEVSMPVRAIAFAIMGGGYAFPGDTEVVTLLKIIDLHDEDARKVAKQTAEMFINKILSGKLDERMKDIDIRLNNARIENLQRVALVELAKYGKSGVSFKTYKIQDVTRQLILTVLADCYGMAIAQTSGLISLG